MTETILFLAIVGYLVSLGVRRVERGHVSRMSQYDYECSMAESDGPGSFWDGEFRRNFGGKK